MRPVRIGLAGLGTVGLAAIAFAALALTGVVAVGERSPTSYAGSPIRMGELVLPARTTATSVELAVDGEFEPRFWPGVNLGSSVPGTFPGEVAATRADYDRWLPQMAELGVRAIRVYTILRPSFYDALRAYNLAHPSAPLYVIHGVWIPEEEFLALQDAYAPEVTDGFRAEIFDAIAVVHGDADLPLRSGHAGGSYTSDVSQWVLAWALGIEWDPQATRGTIAAHPELAPYQGAYQGEYFRAAAGANAMESWLASMLDYTASLEAKRGWSRPLTFTNWLTTDPLSHPFEPFESEDLVSIDPMRVQATDAGRAGSSRATTCTRTTPSSCASRPSSWTTVGPRTGSSTPTPATCTRSASITVGRRSW